MTSHDGTGDVVLGPSLTLPSQVSQTQLAIYAWMDDETSAWNMAIRGGKVTVTKYTHTRTHRYTHTHTHTHTDAS